MPANQDDQRRHQHRDDSRRGHRLQHRDADQGWADRGTWTHLHDDPRATRDSGQGEHDTDRRHSADDTSARRTDSSARQRQSTRRSDTAQGFGSARKGNAPRQNVPGKSAGDPSNTATYSSRGNPRTGSQRDTKSDSVGSDAGGQFGDRHGQRPSGSRVAGYHDDDQFGGRQGRSSQDRRFGSRRGHGSHRREDPRTR